MLFTVVTTPPAELNLPGLAAEVHDSPVAGCARTELYVVFAEDGGGLRISFEYSTDLFEAATIVRFAQNVLLMLERCSE